MRRRENDLASLRFPTIGERAGLARYLPGDATALSPEQRQALGSIVDVRFIGLDRTGPFAGHALYRESTPGGLLGDVVVPERDLDFID